MNVLKCKLYDIQIEDNEFTKTAISPLKSTNSCKPTYINSLAKTYKKIMQQAEKDLEEYGINFCAQSPQPALAEQNQASKSVESIVALPKQ